MRTKHVFMTTAFMALFAACTNEDFLDNAQNVQNGDANLRPLVDVTLNVLDNNQANTRLVFDVQDGYDWQAGDTIGALLMDEFNTTKRPSTEEDWADVSWTTRYKLVDYINTDYPFVRQSNGEWKANAKMLEGNYFFTFPFASYSGNREAVHSIDHQIQNGNNTREAYAKNQFFVGYARIHAGTESTEVMNADLEMLPVLGAVGITVKNTGTGEFTVKKIMLQSNEFSTMIKIDPTKAAYDGEYETKAYNLDGNDATPSWGGGDDYFNYANYEETTGRGDDWQYIDMFEERFGQWGDGSLVNNTEKSQNYERRAALREVINQVKTNKAAGNRAQLTVVNGPTLKSQEEANFIIMTNPYEYVNADDAINAYIYTDKGLVGPVVISNVKEEVSNQGVTVITENPIVKIAPDVMNQVTLQIDDNSVQGPQAMPVYNESDLQQFIEWNKGLKRVYTAELKNDVTLTKEMTDMLTADEWADSKLYIEGDKKLIIAENAAADALDYILVNGEVEVHNDLVLGSNSFVKGTYTFATASSKTYTLSDNKLTIVEGATVTVSSDIKFSAASQAAKRNQELVVAENEGVLTLDADVDKLTITENNAEMNVNAAVTIADNSQNTYEGTINISEDGILRCASKLTNNGKRDGSDIDYAVINNNGQIFNLNNSQYGKVIVGKNSTTNVNNNNGVIDITANIKANVNSKTGTIAYTATGTVEISDINSQGVTELTVDGGTVSSHTANIEVKKVNKIIVTENGGTIGDANTNINFSNASVEVEINGDATLKNITAAGRTIDIKAGTTTIKGTVTAENAIVTIASYDDKAYVAHAATLSVPTASDKLTVNTIWRDNDNHLKLEHAKVDNQGTITADYVYKGSGSNVGVTWSGNNHKQPAADPVKEFTINSAADLANVPSTAETVTIACDLDMTTDANAKLVGKLSGKDIVLDGATAINFKVNGLTIGQLTIGANGATVTGQQNRISLTVDGIDGDGTLTLAGSTYVKTTENAVEGFASETIEATVTGAGAVIANENPILAYDFTSQKWVKLIP